MKEALLTALMKGYATARIDIREMCICLLLATAVALYIFAVYRVFARGTFYDKHFSLSLVGMCLLSSAVLLTVQSSIVVSVGMVGALSIVRFRTAVKDPMDLVFMFWAIVSGIICGAGFALIAILAAVVFTVVLAAVGRVPHNGKTQLLVINADSFDREQPLTEKVKAACSHMKIHSRSVTADGLNMAIEVRTADDHALLEAVLKTEGVRSASLVDHNGDITV